MRLKTLHLISIYIIIFYIVGWRVFVKMQEFRN